MRSSDTGELIEVLFTFGNFASIYTLIGGP